MNALILVDLQNDFVPGGALPVADGHKVVPVANRVLPLFELVVATQDWHPPDHSSFATNHDGRKPGDAIDLNGLAQILWPMHCVQNTPGAELLSGLDRSRINEVFRKGTDPGVDSYSAFFDNGRRRATGLGDFLMDNGVRCVSVMGLATDYCVKFTAMDARSLGFETQLIVDGCRGVELNPGDVRQALRQMQDVGVKIVESQDLLP